MATQILMQKAGNALVPASDYDQELLESVKGQVLVEVSGIRNPDHHRKLWALAAAVARFDQDFHNARDAVRWIKRHIPGMHHRYLEKDGTFTVEYKSISFGAMDQTRFHRFYDRAVWLWSERLGCDVEILERQTDDNRVPEFQD